MNSTKVGGRFEAWVANSTFGCFPPRTGGGVAWMSSLSHWLSRPVGIRRSHDSNAVRSAGGDRYAYRLTIRPPQPDFSVKLTGVNPEVTPGGGKSIKLEADRRDNFDGPIHVEITGLPPGFSVSSPVEIQAGHRTAEAVVYADADAPPPTKADWSQTKVTASAEIDGKTVTHAVNNLGKVTLAAPSTT